MSQQKKPSSSRGQSLFSVVGSVFASMFGVQSTKKHQEDFRQGNISTYLAVGAVATILFVLTVWGIVKLVVSAVQPS
ncbi:DUF2970 family protein [Thiogranum longum]|uniref:DUF2970 family protein n=1 Tax=Thiogranum longum TaxID=1537524 RepID=A0A4R1HEF8_9GAMM|nr:DUF2970 domain-containing protein [Thiogranum longum]TCK19033.1 DUF2970 family protein [Thiogranum longum]